MIKNTQIKNKTTVITRINLTKGKIKKKFQAISNLSLQIEI
jgi:hypothetical protein